MAEASAERIKANNARFRDANERIRDTADSIGAGMERLPFLCECPVEECVEIVHLTPTEYRKVRSDPSHFMTAVGHEAAEGDVAHVVARNDGFVVVEKHED